VDYPIIEDANQCLSMGSSNYRNWSWMEFDFFLEEITVEYTILVWITADRHLRSLIWSFK